jgi:hypothetical protein
MAVSGFERTGSFWRHAWESCRSANFTLILGRFRILDSRVYPIYMFPTPFDGGVSQNVVGPLVEARGKTELGDEPKRQELSVQTTSHSAAIEAARAQTIATVNQAFDDLAATLAPTPPQAQRIYKTPTPADGLDPRNKNGANLTPRGVEILFRAFDDCAGYNRAGKLLNITQGAAKNRKDQWRKLGGIHRVKTPLDIDQ